MHIVNKTFLGTLTESFLIRPINLLSFLIYWSTWNLKSSFESKTMPKCLLWAYFLMTLLLKAIDGWELFFVFLQKITLFTCLLGSRLKFIFHLKVHLLIFSKSFFCRYIYIINFWEKRSIISKNFTYWCYSIRKINYENQKQKKSRSGTLEFFFSSQILNHLMLLFVW